ncbi:MAG: hypothetical protein FJY40_08160 [Betaproteobacteria bacterium]|nr:hypothetical protein [Betaproteobacteria bacterium]
MHPPSMFDFGHGICVVDSVCDWALQTAAHQWWSGAGPRSWIPATALAVTATLAALAQQGIAPGQADFIVLAHVHLDHPGYLC